MNRVNIAVVGCGRIAQVYLEACRSIETINLLAVVDTNPDTAKSVAEEFQCRYFFDYKTMLKKENPDAVIVCTPPHIHFELTMHALSKGKHVLCEKPFAIVPKEAREMVNMSKEKNKLLMMASKFRFVEDIIKAKGIIESGILGEIILFENVFCAHVDMKSRWNSNKRISGGGVLIDNGPHSVDIARFLVGPINAIQAQHGRQIQHIEVEDTSRLYFKTTNGVMGTIDLSWSINKDNEYYINVYGTEGSIHVGWHASKYYRHNKSEEFIFGKGYNKLEAFKRQLEHFIRSLNGKEEPIINGTDAIESVKVIETAYRSSQIDKWLKIEGN